MGRVNMPERSPDSAVALEAGAEGYLPDPVAALHPDLRLNIGQHIPAGPHVKIQASFKRSVETFWPSKPGVTRGGLRKNPVIRVH